MLHRARHRKGRTWTLPPLAHSRHPLHEPQGRARLSQRAGLRMPNGSGARWIHVHENLSISRRFAVRKQGVPVFRSQLYECRLTFAARCGQHSLPLCSGYTGLRQTRATRYGVQGRNEHLLGKLSLHPMESGREVTPSG